SRTWSRPELASFGARRGIGLDVMAAVVARARIHAAFEIQKLHPAELDRMALALQRDIAALERLAVRLHLGTMAGHDAAAVADAAVLDDRLSVDEMHDALAAEHERLGGDPSVAVDRRRLPLDAVRLVEPAAKDDVRAGRAHAAGRTRAAVAQASEELELDRDREILPDGHRLGRLRMQHHAAVPVRPLLDVRGRLADEPV